MPVLGRTVGSLQTPSVPIASEVSAPLWRRAFDWWLAQVKHVTADELNALFATASCRACLCDGTRRRPSSQGVKPMMGRHGLRKSLIHRAVLRCEKIWRSPSCARSSKPFSQLYF